MIHDEGLILQHRQPLILIVDDVPKNIQVLGSLLRKENYLISAATSGTQALKIMETNRPDLLLLDVMMPDMSGYDVIRQLKLNPVTANIPVLFITALTEEADETKGLALGAVDYITKPFSFPIVAARVKTHLKLKQHQNHLEELVRQRTTEVVETQLEIVYRLARAAEYRDNETGLHIRRLSHYCRLLAEKIGMDAETCELLFNTSAMHDVGKIGIPDAVLLKPGRLDEREYNIIKTHPQIGAEILDGHLSTLLRTARSIALTHHEKWDGSGYPQGLSGENIPIEGRITAICDVYDALTSDRPYKTAWSDEQALAEINAQAGKQFDPQLVQSFHDVWRDIIAIRQQFRDA